MAYKWLPPSGRHQPLWEGVVVEKIQLENGLLLEIWDYSRKLAGDRWLVGFLAQIAVKPNKEDFTNQIYYEHFLKETDGHLYYRYRKERTFIPEEKVKEIYRSIKENFFKAVLPYLSREDFKNQLLQREIALFEKRVDWELYLQEKKKQEEELEKLYQDKEYF